MKFWTVTVRLGERTWSYLLSSRHARAAALEWRRKQARVTVRRHP